MFRSPLRASFKIEPQYTESMDDLVVGMVGGHRYHISLPLVRRLLYHLAAELAPRRVVVLLARVGNRLVTKLVRYGNLKPFLEGGSLDELVMPRLDLGELVEVDTGPVGRVSVDKYCDISNRQAVPSHKRGSGQWQNQ